MVANEKAETHTSVERKNDREVVVTRTINGPAHLVFAAWTKPDLMKRWWVPKSSGMTLLSCQMDTRTGGTYRFEFAHPNFPEPMAFFGKYMEVVPNTRIVWTNEESDQGAVSTLTFAAKGGKTLLVLHEVYPTKEALEASIEGTEGGMPEQFEQLDGLLAELG